MAVVTVAVMDRGWSEYLAQDFLLQLPVDGRDTPATMMSHWGPTFVYDMQIKFALPTAMVLQRIVSRAHPRVRCSRSWW